MTTLSAESPGTRWGRRLRTIPALIVGFAVATALLPVILAVTGVYDLVRAARHRGRFAAVRSALFGWVYLLVEVAGLTCLLLFWIVTGWGRRRRLLLRLTFALQGWWGKSLLGAVRLLFRVRLEVEGDEVAAKGPFVLLVRHASLVDTLLPTVLIIRRHHIRLRHVLKRELLWDPALDVAGNTTPNYFIDRRRGAGEVEAVRALADGLGPGDGVAIWPEGTRFTPERQARALAALGRQDPALAALASDFGHVLPPRLGGPLALLDIGTDVVICAHVGFDGLSHVKSILGGGIVGTTVRVAFWRIAAADIPSDYQGRVRWLFDQWGAVDRWVGAHLQAV
jgi:1-acyl-sn-glycerol-3-phosphate acyltransferase